MQLIDNRGFADPRISGDKHQLRSAGSDNTVEGGKQSIDFASASVQFLGNQEPIWHVVLPKHEFVNPPLSFPFHQAAPEITLDTGRRLIALLRSLGQ